MRQAVAQSVALRGTLVREFHFTDEHFETIRQLVAKQAGIRLTDAKKDMVYSRLSRRLRKLGLRDFGAYCELITTADGLDERVELVNAITTNLTSFFREPHHFQFLADRVLPQLFQESASTHQLRFWSAGCSSGEEAYSMAMVVHEALKGRPGWGARILATDLDSNVLDSASRGIYAADRVKGIPPIRLSRHFLRGSGNKSGLYKAKPALQELISFQQLNLHDAWQFRRPFDAIFCRNVVIYFSKKTQRQLFERFADSLIPGGYLFLGHSESLFRVCDRFELLGNTVYRRVA